MNKRFKFNLNLKIINDNLTGEQYYTLSSITKLLNKLNNKADENTEQFDEYMYEYYMMKSTLKRYNNLMEKYGINSFEELENIIRDCL